jgi:hypothetical protein
LTKQEINNAGDESELDWRTNQSLTQAVVYVKTDIDKQISLLVRRKTYTRFFLVGFHFGRNDYGNEKQ